MARRRAQRPISPDDIDEGPSDEDIDRFSDVTHKCPSCGTVSYDDAEICWKCGSSMSGSGSAKPPLWVWITAAVLLIGMIVMMLR